MFALVATSIQTETRRHCVDASVYRVMYAYLPDLTPSPYSPPSLFHRLNSATPHIIP